MRQACGPSRLSSGTLRVYNGVDVAINARFGTGGILAGGVAVGRTTFDYCWMNDLPQVTQVGKAALGFTQVTADRPRVASHCRIQSPWWDGVGSQIKLQAVYPLPGDFTISGVFKQLPGVPLSATYIVPNALVAPALGRDLAGCRGAVGAACTASVSVALLPGADNQGDQAAVKFDDRLNQVDLRLTRLFRVGGGRLQGALELYNVFDARPSQANVITYGSSWLVPSAILGGRLLKFAAQIDF